MTATLPRGLINPTAPEDQTFAEPGTNVNNQDVIRRFWRVYAIQSDASQDGASTRCRNLFWRLWSSPNLAQSISSATLMTLLNRCNQDFDLRPIGHHLQLPPLPSDENSPHTSAAPRLQPSSSSRPSETRPSPQTGAPAGQFPGPSLQSFQFPPAPAPQVGQLRRRSTAQTHASGQTQADDTSGSTSNTTSESGSRPSLTRSASSSRQRTPVLVTAGKSRTRPNLPRRKSSLQKSPGGPSTAKTPKDIQEAAKAAPITRESGFTTVPQLARTDPPPGLLNPNTTTSGEPFALPSASSWQSVDSGTEHPPLATTAPQPILGDLVDPGFREKFVATQKKLSSVTNLPSLDRIRKSGSVVRFADQKPEDFRKGKEKLVLPPLADESTGSRQGQSNDARGALTRRREEVKDREQENDDDADDNDEEDEDEEDDKDDDDDDDDSDVSDDSDDAPQMEIHRTKSQLSMLIRNRRDQTGSQDLGPEQPEQSSEAAKPKGKDKSKEEELLSMGRKDGVTKDGGIQLPRQQRVTEQDDPGYQSSSSPEPLF